MIIKGPGIKGECSLSRYIIDTFLSAIRVAIAIAVALILAAIFAPSPWWPWLLGWLPWAGGLTIAVTMHVTHALPADE